MNDLLYILNTSLNQLNMLLKNNSQINWRERVKHEKDRTYYYIELLDGKNVFYREVTCTPELNDQIKRLTLRTLLAKLNMEGMMMNYKKYLNKK